MNRADLLKKLVNKPQSVTIDGYGDYKVRGLSTSDYLFAASHSTVDGEDKMDQDAYFAALVARCVFDTKGKRLFKDEDVEILKAGDATFILPLALEIQALSGSLNSEADVKKG